MNASRSLNDVLEAARRLSPEEQARLRALLSDAGSDVDTSIAEDAFAERLAAIGLLERRRASSPSAACGFHPVPARGKSTSAVLIEDRR